MSPLKNSKIRKLNIYMKWERAKAILDKIVADRFDQSAFRKGANEDSDLRGGVCLAIALRWILLRSQTNNHRATHRHLVKPDEIDKIFDLTREMRRTPPDNTADRANALVLVARGFDVRLEPILTICNSYAHDAPDYLAKNLKAEIGKIISELFIIHIDANKANGSPVAGHSFGAFSRHRWGTREIVFFDPNWGEFHIPFHLFSHFFDGLQAYYARHHYFFFRARIQKTEHHASAPCFPSC